MSGWNSIKLGELVNLTGGAPFKSSEFGDCGIPVLKIKNVKANRLLLDDVDHISKDVAKEYPESFLQKGDLLITMTGNRIGGGMDSWVGKVARFNEDRQYCLNQRVGIIRPKSSHAVDIRFLSFCLSTGDSQRELIQIATGSGGQANLSPKQILAVKVPHPPLSEQRAIASVLGSLDDKIELNRRINETLEALAQTLFKSWFVDATQSALPKGWREMPLPEAIAVNPSRPLRKGAIAPYLDMANMPTRSARALEIVDREFGSGMRFKNGDTLVARITPCLENGKTCFVDFLNDGQIAWGSTEYIVLQPKPPLPPEFAYFLARTDEFRAFMISNMTGTTGRQRVPAECLSNFKIAIPPDELAAKFGQFASAAFAQMKAHDEESRTLSALRDALLPKLLSGELRVPAAAKLADATQLTNGNP